jgi:hypothetical protein
MSASCGLTTVNRARVFALPYDKLGWLVKSVLHGPKEPTDRCFSLPRS